MKKNSLISFSIGSALMLSLSLVTLCTAPAGAQKAVVKSAPRYDLNTVSGLKAFIAARKQQEAKEKKRERDQHKGKEKEREREKSSKRTFGKRGSDEEKEGTGFYEERLARLKERAYPNDRMDVDAILLGVEQRERLQPTVLKRPGIRTAAVGGGGPAGSWEFVGPKNLPVPYTTYYGPVGSATTGRVSGIAFHPTDPKTIYLAAPIAGIHKSVDGGTTWTAVGDSFPIPFTSCVAVDPNNPEIVYAGLGDHDYGIDQNGWWFGGAYNARQIGGIMRSTDGGATWTRSMGFVQGCDVNSIATDPDTPGLVLAAYAGPTGGIYRSVNYGETWRSASTTITTVEDIEVGVPDATGKRAFYLVSGGNRIFRSTDKGASWTQITGIGGSGRVRIAASAVNANVLYMTSTSDQRIRRGTRNTGTGAWTWTDITGNHPQNYGPGSNWGQVPYDYHMECAAHTVSGTKQDTLYLGLITISASPGANGTWIDIGRTGSAAARTHNDQHCFGIFPGNPNIMAVGNDGGIYGLTYTPSAGAPTLNSWNFAIQWNRNIGLTAFHNSDFHPTNPNIMIGGTQDNATAAARGDLNNWANPGAGDGFGSAINPSNPAIQFLTVYGGVVARTANTWTSGTDITPAYNNESPGFFTWVGIDPTAPGHFYLGTQYLWRYNETTKAWEGHLGTTKLSNDYIRAITVAPSDNKRLYVGTTDGQFWVSTDQGANWTKRTGLPNRAYTSIFVNPVDPDHIRVAVGGTGSGHLYESWNAGVSFNDISGNGTSALPDVPANAVTADASSIWVGTDIGVFSSVDGGQTWNNATQPLGLPNTEVSSLKMVPGTSYLMAATYGRGMWRLPVTVDNNWVKGNPFGTGTIVASAAAVAKVGNAPVLSLTLQNIGDGIAKDVTVQTAGMVLGSDPGRSATNIPFNAGVITNGTQKVVALNFPASTQPSGSVGTVKVTGTYLRTIDQSVQSFTGFFKVQLP